MSGGVARQVMVHRCTTQRNAATIDDLGAEGASNWQTRLASQPCRAFFTSGRLQQTPGQTEAIAELRLLLPLGTDVQDGDRIASISDRGGSVLFAGPLGIQGPIARRADHLVLALQEVS